MDQQRQQPSPLNLISYLKTGTPSPGKPAQTQQTGMHHAQLQGERSASSSTAFQYRSSAGEQSQRVVEIGGRRAPQTSLHEPSRFEQTSHSSIAYNYPNLSNSDPFFGFTGMFGGPGDSTTYRAPARDHLPKSFHEASIASNSNIQPLIFDYPAPSMIASLPVPVLPIDPSANSLPFDLNIPQHEISDQFLPPPSETIEMPVPGREDLRSVPRKYPALYSETGFDLISVLSRMANRPNPQIDIGPVDLSCSFLVVDANQYDFPIVYVSPTFSKLTDYAEEEIMGRNCRFLQAPDGHVVKGSRRRYTDNAAVHHLKTHIVQRKESQSSLINYRKGGQPFINLVTIIPVLGDNKEVMFFVGLQIDLVEQPNAILARMRNGTYTVNYSLNNIPPNFPAAASTNEQNDPYLQQASVFQVLPFPATAEIVSLMGGPPTDSEAAKRIWSRMLLHNCVDFVYVLSLKGTFLYCSPAVRRLLQFDPEELVGRNFSSVCHPLDVVPVTRELKHASSGSPGFVDTVSLVFRIRRKLSGYMWLEAEGNLHFDQGKSRKFFIMSGKPRPVYSLSRHLLKSNSTPPSVGGNMEMWAKLSLDGLYLYASSAAQSLFGIPAEELANTSMYQHVRPDRTTDLTRALSQARRGAVVTLRHSFQNRRGQFVDVVTTFWPNGMAQSSSMTGKDQTGPLPNLTISSTGRPPSGKSGATSNAPILTAPQERALPISPEFSSAQGFSDEDTMSTQVAVNPSTPLPSCSFFICQTREYSAPDGSEPSTQDTQVQDFPNENNDDNVFDLLETVRGTSWQFELHQLRLENKKMKDEIEENLLARKKKKKRRIVPVVVTTCAHCHCEVSPEWRKGPTGPRSLCNACGLRYARTQSVLPTEPEDAEASRSEEMENEDTEI